MDAEEAKYFVGEWTIKNFSCWNSELHDKVIASTKTCTYNEFWVELYPRGLSGNGEHLVVLLHRSNPMSFFGDLSFIGPDGSLISTQQVHSKEKVSVLELPPGPKFEVVVAQIRKKEARHKDRLTVRWRMKNASEIVQYMCTTINAFDVFFKTSSKILDCLSSTPILLSALRYPFEEENMDELQIKYEEDRFDCSKIRLILNPFRYVKNVINFTRINALVRTRMTVLSNENVVRTEENEHLFQDPYSWVFCNSLTRKEVSKEGFSLNICLKVIPGRKYTHGLSVYEEFPMTVQAPTMDFKPPGTSISEERSSSGETTAASNKPEASVGVLTKELMCLYQDHDFSDFQLKCGDVTFPVHRAILSARSPVFKTMLSCDMKEAASGCMDIEDLDISTLSLFLTYLYTGGVEDLQGDGALKLYYTADKYQVPTLKKECVSVLCSSVSISNACDILSLADKHHDDHLLSVAHEFFLSNFNEVLASEEWKSFMRSEPLLAVETLTHFGEKKYFKRNEAS